VKGEILFRLFAGDVAAFLDRVVAWDGRSWDG
jgi:creatinine amidohydrolase